MDLKTYFKSTPGAAKKLADALEIDQSFMGQIASNRRPASPERCVAIERATNGKVTRKDLRPLDWHLIWPELMNRGARQRRAA